ncbi:MAG: hypothetical protein H6670_18525 [Anaerolineaceae bacterium]|nr:hypothetical protein [Anaerolineaceae bacterium]
MSQKLPPNQSNSDDTSRTDAQRTRPITGQFRSRTEHSTQSTGPHVVTPNTRTGQQVPVRPQANPTTSTARQRHARRASKRGSFYIPLWSIGVMVLGVVIVAVLAIAGIIAMGGSNATPASTPIIRIITSEANANTASGLQLTPATAVPGSRTILSVEDTPEALTLNGPTLPAVVITPTPVGITVGATIAVRGVDDQQLNVRNVPGINDTSIQFRADEDEQFLVVEGPVQADGFTWWRIQDAVDTTRSGWAVSNYLGVIATPQ